MWRRRPWTGRRHRSRRASIRTGSRICRSTAATSSIWRCSRSARRRAAQGSAGSVRGDFAFNVNGAREDANSFLLDGAYNFDPKLNTRRRAAAGRRHSRIRGDRQHAGRDASARPPAAQVNVITRSGAQPAVGDRHTSSGGRGPSTRATTSRRRTSRRRTTSVISTAPRSAARSSKDRLFFFADYEGTRLTEGHHAGDQRADAGRARRRLLRQPVHDRRTFPACRFRGRQSDSPERAESDRPVDRESVSAAEPGRAVRELRVLTRADRRRRSVRYPRRLPWRRPEC